MECAVCFAVATASVMGNRLCLNIRAMAQDPEISGDDLTQDTLTTPTCNRVLPLYTREFKQLASGMEVVERDGTLN